MTCLPAFGTEKNGPAYDRLLQNPNYYQAKLSPNGRYLAFQTEYKSRRSIAVFDLREKESRGITVNPGQDMDDLYWISNDTIAYHVSKWGIYTEGLHSYNLERGRPKELLATRNNRLVFQGMVDPLPQLEDRYVFKASRAGLSGDVRHAGDLYLGYARGGTPRLLAENTGHIVHWVVGQDGRPLYAVEAKGGNRRVLRWQTEESSWMATGAIAEDLSPVGTIHDDLLLCKLTGDEGTSGIQLLNLDKGEPVAKPRFVPGYDLTSGRVLRNNQTYRILGIEFHHEKPANFFFDAGLQQIEKRLDTLFPDKAIHYLGIDGELGAFYFSVESSREPGRLFRLRLESGNVEPLISQYTGLEDLFLRPMQTVDIPVPEEERTLPAYLTTPDGDGPWPAILWTHGGPHVRDTWGFDPYVQYWAARGYAVLQVNYRGSTGYGVRHGPFPLGKSARLAVEDILVAAKWLQGEGIADPAATAVAGNSFGAYVAVEAVMREDAPFSAAVGISGLYDLEEVRRQDKRRHRHWTDDLFADYDEKEYAHLSPVNHADRATAPVMILHGKADRRVGLNQAKAMVKNLKQAGKPVEYEYYGWGVHAFPDEEDRPEFFDKIHRFLLSQRLSVAE